MEPEIGDSHLFVDVASFDHSTGMPGHARVVIPGMSRHIKQPGNSHQDLFFVDEDRDAYLELPRERCKKHGGSVLGNCLMTNHNRFVATPAQEDASSLA